MAVDERERLIADSQFGVGGWSMFSITYAPSLWYLGLSWTTPNEDGSNFTEPVGLGYARVAVTNNFTNFPLAVTSLGVTTKSNGAPFNFPTPSGYWGLLSHYGWFVASSGGLPQYTHELNQPIPVNTGNTPVGFDTGLLVMVWD